MNNEDKKLIEQLKQDALWLINQKTVFDACGWPTKMYGDCFQRVGLALLVFLRGVEKDGSEAS